MGYSLQVVAESKSSRDEMAAFMAERAKDVETRFSSGVEKRRGNKLAIEYSSCLEGETRIFVYSLARWMALKVGALKGKYSKDSVDPNTIDPVPYIVYDGYESWPVIAFPTEREAMEKLPESLWWCATDPLGVYLGEKTSGSVVSSISLNLYSNKKRVAAFDAEVLSTIGPCTQGDKTWLEKKNEILAKHCKKDIDQVLKKVRNRILKFEVDWMSPE